MTRILIATRNRHKVGEIQGILGEARACLALDDFPGAPGIAETGTTFAANARLKAEGIAAWLIREGRAETVTYVLADDSGLEVDALGGAPGVHSARFAGLDAGHQGNSADADNNAKLLRLLAAVPVELRKARFRCVMALASVGGPMSVDGREYPPGTHVFEGRCEGRIDVVQRGEGGFGYDPLFIPDGFGSSFAELGEAVKNRISHRAQALAALLDHLRQPR